MENTHEALIDEATFETVQKRLSVKQPCTWTNVDRIVVHEKELEGNEIIMRVEVNEDYSVIDFYYNLGLDAQKVPELILGTETYSAYHQVFSGHENWFITINIYNCDTGKIVVATDSDHKLHYEQSDWEASE